MTKRHWWIVALALLLTCGGSALGWWWTREDPQLAKVRQLGQDLFEKGRDLPREERREKWNTLREETEKLTDQQREKLDDERRQEFERRTVERLTAFFKLPVEEQDKQIDEEIDRMQRWREERERRRSEGEGRERRGPPSGGPPGGRGFSRGPQDANSRNERRRDRLDRSSPEFRALTYEYGRRMGDRMKSRGIPQPAWFGGR